MQIFQKSHLLWWSAFPSEWLPEYTKMWNWGLRKSSCNPWETNAPTTRHCLVRILVRRRDCYLLFWKWGRNCSDSERHSLQQHDNGVLVASTGRHGSRGHAVSARRRHLPHRAWCRTNYLQKFGCQLATKIMRFNFLWGFVKSRVYANKSETFPELKSEIQGVIDEIQPHLCEKVIENFMKRVMACDQSRGGYLTDILFHT